MTQQGFDFSRDLVEMAEKVVGRLELNKRGSEMLLTYGQLRKVLGNIVAIKNKLSVYQSNERDFSKLPEEIAFDIKFLKTSLLYQAGRIEVGRSFPMKSFLNESQLLEIINSIDTNIQRFEYLCKYIEAIVAFYKYRSVNLKK